MAYMRSHPGRCVRGTQRLGQRSQGEREGIRDTETDHFCHDTVPTELVPTCGPTALLLDDVPIFPGQGRPSPGTVTRE